jgi:hypothetical protein
LEFLRTFGCVTNNEAWEVDHSLCTVTLSYEGDLQFFWSAASEDRTLMQGGLNYHGIHQADLKVLQAGGYEGRLCDVPYDLNRCSWSVNT